MEGGGEETGGVSEAVATADTQQLSSSPQLSSARGFTGCQKRSGGGGILSIGFLLVKCERLKLYSQYVTRKINTKK
jgi:hypothetical protein